MQTLNVSKLRNIPRSKRPVFAVSLQHQRVHAEIGSVKRNQVSRDQTQEPHGRPWTSQAEDSEETPVPVRQLPTRVSNTIESPPTIATHQAATPEGHAEVHNAYLMIDLMSAVAYV